VFLKNVVNKIVGGDLAHTTFGTNTATLHGGRGALFPTVMALALAYVFSPYVSQNSSFKGINALYHFLH